MVSGDGVSGDEVSGDEVSGDPVAEAVSQAVAELYGAAPETFTERRGELAAAARSAGDRAAAKAIGALRRPTRAAWVVNRLARTDPSAPARLAELGGALRAAEQARQGARLRELSAARGALIDGLTAQALAEADVAEPPAGLRDEVAATLTAALADPAVAADFAAGTLTRAAHWSGFGSVDFGVFGADTASKADTGTDSETETDEADRDRRTEKRGVAGGTRAPDRPAGRRLTLVPPRPRASAREAPARAPKAASATPERTAVDADADTATARAAAAADAAQAAARRAALAQAELARAAAEQAAQRRQKYAEAERVLAAAVSAAADAGVAEERLEAEVRELEDRLTRARVDLAATRMNARHAEAAERRARTTIDRLAPE